MDYTIIGNEVNLAARLQSAAEPGGILISHETNALVRDIVLTEEQPPMTVKWFLRPISSYKLLGTYKELVDEGKVVLQEREGLRVLVDLTKRVSSEAIAVLEEILAQLKQRSSDQKESQLRDQHLKHAHGAPCRGAGYRQRLVAYSVQSTDHVAVHEFAYGP